MFLLSLTNTEPFQKIYNTDFLNVLFELDKDPSLNELYEFKTIYLVTENENNSLLNIHVDYNKNATGLGIFVSDNNIDWKDDLYFLISTDNREIREIYIKLAVIDNRYFIDRSLSYPLNKEESYFKITVENEKDNIINVRVDDNKSPDKYNNHLLIAQADENLNKLSDFSNELNIPVYTNNKQDFYFIYKWFVNKRHINFQLYFLFSIDKIGSFSSYKLVYDDKKCLFSSFDTLTDERSNMFSSYDTLTDERNAYFEGE